jgi:hypothetical protein
VRLRSAPRTARSRAARMRKPRGIRAQRLAGIRQLRGIEERRVPGAIGAHPVRRAVGANRACGQDLPYGESGLRQPVDEGAAAAAERMPRSRTWATARRRGAGRTRAGERWAWCCERRRAQALARRMTPPRSGVPCPVESGSCSSAGGCQVHAPVQRHELAAEQTVELVDGLGRIVVPEPPEPVGALAQRQLPPGASRARGRMWLASRGRRPPWHHTADPRRGSSPHPPSRSQASRAPSCRHTPARAEPAGCRAPGSPTAWSAPDCGWWASCA